MASELSASENILIEELKEINLYVRLNWKTYVAGVSFLFTGNMLGTGWIFLGNVDSNSKQIISMVVSTAFIVGDFLLWKFTHEIDSFTCKQEERILEIISTEKESDSLNIKNYKSPIPKTLYLNASKSIRIAFIVMMIWWTMILLNRIFSLTL